jgi:1-deoxy-D-xylulose-5-phosphate synthase
VVTIEEHVLAGGFGSAILELICDNGLSGCRVKRVGVNDVFVEHGSQNELRKDYGIDASAVVAAGLKLCREE